MCSSQHWQTNSDAYILISTLPGLVTEDCLSPKDFSFFRGRSWQWELSGKHFHNFSGKTCSGEMTEDCVRIFGCEFFLLNGRSFKFRCQQVFQLRFKPQAFQMTWIGSMAGGRSLILPEILPLGNPNSSKHPLFQRNVKWGPKHDFESALLSIRIFAFYDENVACTSTRAASPQFCSVFSRRLVRRCDACTTGSVHLQIRISYLWLGKQYCRLKMMHWEYKPSFQSHFSEENPDPVASLSPPPLTCMSSPALKKIVSPAHFLPHLPFMHYQTHLLCLILHQ